MEEDYAKITQVFDELLNLKYSIPNFS